MESNTKATFTNAPEQSGAKIISVGDLLSYLLRVKDGRKRRGIRYSLATVLTLLILAKLCGQNKVYGIAFLGTAAQRILGGSIRVEA